MRPEKILDELDGDLRTLMGLWATATAAWRGLIPTPPPGGAALEAWWLEATAKLAEGVPSALYVDPTPLSGPVLRRALDDLGRGAEAGLGLVAEAAADPGALGDVYSALGDPEARKQGGRFYTPRGWIQHALPPNLSAGQRVLDPACGGGRFLLAVLDRMAPGDPSPTRAEVAEACLYGVDADPLAVAICQAALHLACATPRRFEVAVDVNIEHGDPLLGLAAARLERGKARDQLGLFAPPPPPRPTLDGEPRRRRALMRGWRVRQAAQFRARYALVEPSLKAGAEAAPPLDLDLSMPTPFDVVVGNPPYRGGRHRSLPAEDDLYRRTFEVAEYQLDPYALFLELALTALAPGGRLAMVVPNAWMSNLKAKRLRRLLVEAHEITEIVELPPEIFDAGVETVALHLIAEGQPTSASPVRSIPVLGWAEGALDGPPSLQGRLTPDLDHPEAPIPLSRDPQTADLLVRSRQWRATFGDVAEITRGVNPYHRATHTPEQIAERVHHADGPTEGYVPELRGRDLGAYRLWWSGRYWIHYGPWLKEPRDPRFFEGPRLLVRKVFGDTLCAAYTEDPLICDQSVYIARLIEGQPWPAGALLAMVSSEVVATLLRARHQEHDRLFPQLKLAELRGLPLPPIDPRDPALAALGQKALALQALEAAYFDALGAEAEAELPDLDPVAKSRRVRRLMKAGWADGLEADRAEAEALRREIEDEVAALYGVRPEPAPSTPPMEQEYEMSERGLLSPGDALPPFELRDDRGAPITDDDLAGKIVVLYFYPKDDTPGCTKESCDFRDLKGEFEAKGASIYGISADDVESHQAFRDKYSLSFPLIADPEHGLCEAFGVWGKQSWQGHEYVGIARTTFIIKDKIVARVYPDVSVAEHASEVLADLSEI